MPQTPDEILAQELGKLAARASQGGTGGRRSALGRAEDAHRRLQRGHSHQRPSRRRFAGRCRSARFRGPHPRPRGEAIRCPGSSRRGRIWFHGPQSGPGDHRGGPRSTGLRCRDRKRRGEGGANQTARRREGGQANRRAVAGHVSAGGSATNPVGYGKGSPIIIRYPTQTFVPSYLFGSNPGWLRTTSSTLPRSGCLG
jgi:hypothetical protein